MLYYSPLLDVCAFSNLKVLAAILQSENLEAWSDKSQEVLDLEVYSMKSNTETQTQVYFALSNVYTLSMLISFCIG